ncbi:hypothetical protein HPP92_024952 [Vanilla planifolia]|uniref:noroxomaritidine synthase n=1 Tax=Vanilla planifolia TaxID=51239 RepID=A0A835PKM4_VANPL|nr:hypothetical protein HPP92_024952 [Vanilla planifolia]
MFYGKLRLEARLKRKQKVIYEFVFQLINKRENRRKAESNSEGYLCKHLSLFCCMLCKNPVVQEKIVAEIQWLVGPQTTPFNIDAFVDRLREKELDRMQYLHAALTETLRLFLVVPLDGKFAAGDDLLPEGFKNIK